MGSSDSKYDFIYAPYRNTDRHSPVYIKKISFTDGSIERWSAGAPEFYLKVVGDQSGKVFEIQPQMAFLFPRFHQGNSWIFDDRKAFDWEYFIDRDWYSSMTFILVEYDLPSGEMTVSANVKFNTKIPMGKDGSGGGFDAGVGIDMKATFSHKGEECGQAVIDYFDNPEATLQFPGYGAEIVISERP